jgi:hypothetical protein
MQFVRLGMGGGVEFRMGHGDRAETGHGRHQRPFFRAENPLLARVDEDCTLGARGAKRSRDENPG